MPTWADYPRTLRAVAEWLPTDGAAGLHAIELHMLPHGLGIRLVVGEDRIASLVWPDQDRLAPGHLAGLLTSELGVIAGRRALGKHHALYPDDPAAVTAP